MLNPARPDEAGRLRASVDAGPGAPIVIELHNVAGERVLRATHAGEPGDNFIPVATGGLAGGVYYYRVTIDGRAEPFGKLALVK